MSDEATFDPVRPDDPDEQLLYLRRLRWQYPDETARVDDGRLRATVNADLKLCPLLRINDPKDVVRFLLLSIVITPEQRRSTLLDTVIRRVIEASVVWSARKRLDFIYKHVVGRAAPDPEPDFGPWFANELRDFASSFPEQPPSGEHHGNRP